jgi:RimJ/RimL family protein N-acetyltransferase
VETIPNVLAGGLHKELGGDECLFEFAYTFEAFRGLGVMGAALAEIIAQLIKEHPALQWGYTYVLDDNIASLKGCRNAGFRPYMERREHWRALKINEEFFALTPGSRFPFEVSSVSEKSNANRK